MSSLLRIDRYFGHKAQPLRNVPVLTPSIIVVTAGVKYLQWQGEAIAFNRHNWLLAAENQPLTFINEPSQDKFQSIQISFKSLPSEALLKQLSAAAIEQSDLLNPPSLAVNDSLNFALSQLIAMAELPLSTAAQQCYLDGFYQQLFEAGALSQLFAHRQLSLRQKLSRYLAIDPASNHSIENTCGRFAMSQATFMRHLSKEGTSFREVLAEVRMLNAISVMQTVNARNEQPLTQLELAFRCGYQSESRFSQRFKTQFGISLKQYAQTITC
ncbi:AraC family transcriptional regulator [Shewanella sp. 1CM18E]|uniref:helix-turn-helix transcriptional regulator n=1 Tax=Shewanella sp. 1CM18E TaxID=2929169 RepID=UPI0020C0674F|nr:AraC family transcriptional regulator [Shewanella sp. 1CM18E]